MSIRLRVDPQHPSFAGHFEGQPLLPGAALLAHYILPNIALPPGVTQQQCCLQKLKFSAPVLPGDELLIHCRNEAQNKRMHLRVERTNDQVDQETCATGVLCWF